MNLITAIIDKKLLMVLKIVRSDPGCLMCCEDWCEVTPLHHAINSSTVSIVFVLAFYGADLNRSDKGLGYTAIELAFKQKKYTHILIVNLAKLFSKFRASKKLSKQP